MTAGHNASAEEVPINSPSKAASDLLLSEHGIYSGDQLSHCASYRYDAPIDALAEPLVDVWEKLGPAHNLQAAA